MTSQITGFEYALERLTIYAYFLGQVDGILETHGIGANAEALKAIREAVAETEKKLAALQEAE